MDNLEKKIIEMLAERSGVDVAKISPQSQLNVDITLDSLSFAELLMDCEDTYKVEIPLDDATQFKTVQDIIDYLKKNAA